MNLPAASVLVVDSDAQWRDLCAHALPPARYLIHTARHAAAAQALLQQQRYDVLITSLELPGSSGLDLLQHAHSHDPALRCVVTSSAPAIASVVQAMQRGACDYWPQPMEGAQLLRAMAALLPSLPIMRPLAHTQPAFMAGAPARQHAAARALHRLHGHSAGLEQLKRQIQHVAPSMASVLICGESGTGKERVAQALHACSPRATGPWVAVNCAAIPEHLMEAEFFGVCKGAFTGATVDRPGFFRAAQGGTLFLDEVGELPLAMQTKLLRVLQERCVRPLGATDELPVDVRILSATLRNLEDDVRQGLFRPDLFYRLNVIDLHVPPLRERREDLPDLCRALLEGLSPDAALNQRITHALMPHLQRLPLPGNVRELENLLHRALVLGELPRTAPLPTTVPTVPDMAPLGAHGLPENLTAWLDQQEHQMLERALRASHFNRTAAAARLGLSLRQMRYRIARLNIGAPLAEVPRNSDNRRHDVPQ